jgi:hypothetical protein
MDALSRANEVRTLRAKLKRDLKARRVSIGALLLDPPPYLETAKVFDMVLAIPKVGRVKATKILQSCQVSPSKTFGGLSERQRAELAVERRSNDSALRTAVSRPRLVRSGADGRASDHYRLAVKQGWDAGRPAVLVLLNQAVGSGAVRTAARPGVSDSLTAFDRRARRFCW